jgi:hypothetical protein
MLSAGFFMSDKLIASKIFKRQTPKNPDLAKRSGQQRGRREVRTVVAGKKEHP